MVKNEQIFPELSNPPAMEVILGIEIEDDPAFNAENLNIIEKKFRSRFPLQEEFKEFISKIDTKTEEVTHEKSGLIGYLYKADHEEASHFRTNGFTYSKLGNYPGGETFFQNTAKIWNIYKKLRSNIKPTRLGLRYINVITVDNFNYDYGKFFHTFVQTPEKIGKTKKMRYLYTKEFEKQNCLAKVHFQLDTVKDNREAKFILDIDITKNDLPAALSDENIKAFFEEMRYCKNIIFFSTLCEDLLEQYK